MASNFQNYQPKKRGVCESTLLKATKVGHHYNVVSDEELENGCMCKLGEYVREDIWQADIPAIGDKLVLINSPVKIYETYTTRMQEESNYFIAPQEVARANEIQDTDRFTLSKEAFSDAANPEVGEYVGVDGAGYKLTTLGKADPGATYGFLGKIYAIANNGNYRIWVVRNNQL